ncbi:MAG: hypothetical protein ACE5JS_13400 [Nitrospinota bacterium]
MPLLDALTCELRRIQEHRERFGKRRPVHIPPHIMEYVQDLEAENLTLQDRLNALEAKTDPDPDSLCPRWRQFPLNPSGRPAGASTRRSASCFPPHRWCVR